MKRGNSTFGWSQFGRCASGLRQQLDDGAASPLVFVPCYAAQDVDGGVYEAMEGRRSRFWPFRGTRDRCRPAAQDELIRRDWLARADGRRDGIYIEDFWAHFVEDGQEERRGIESSLRPYSLGGPAYVAPLVIRPKAA